MPTGAKSSPQDAGEPLEGSQSGEPHVVARGDKAGAQGRRGPHVPLRTDCQYGNFHLGLRLSVLLRCPAGFRPLAAVVRLPHPPPDSCFGRIPAGTRRS